VAMEAVSGSAVLELLYLVVSAWKLELVRLLLLALSDILIGLKGSWCDANGFILDKVYNKDIKLNACACWFRAVACVCLRMKSTRRRSRMFYTRCPTLSLTGIATDYSEASMNHKSLAYTSFMA
jgi:hypothetical protein